MYRSSVRMLFFVCMLAYNLQDANAQNFYTMVPPELREKAAGNMTLVANSNQTLPEEKDLLAARRNITFEKYKYELKSFSINVIASGMGTANAILGIFIPNPYLKAAVSSIGTLGISEWKENRVDNYYDNFKKDIRNTFSDYSQNFLKQNPRATQGEVAENYRRFVKADIVGDKEYNVIGKEVDLLVLDYMSKEPQLFTDIYKKSHRTRRRGENNINDINPRHKKALEQGVVSIQTSFQGEVIEYIKSFEAFQSKVTSKFDDVHKDMEEMNVEIKAQNIKIEENAQQINVLKDRQDLTDEQMKSLFALQSTNRKLIEENAFKVDVIADVLYGNVDTESKITLIKKGVVQVKDPAKEVERLEKIAFVEKLNYYTNVGFETVTLAQNLGLASEDADRANKLLTAVSTASQLYMAYQKGDVLSGIQAVNTAFRVFGGKKPKPDPMFAAMMEQFRIVNMKLDSMDKKLDIISSKIDHLVRLEMDLHNETTRQLNSISDQMVKVLDRQDYMIRILTAQCSVLGYDSSYFSNLKTKLDSVKNLDELKTVYLSDNKVSNILNCLYSAIQTNDLSDKTFIHANRYDEKGTLTEIYLNLLFMLQHYKGSEPDYVSNYLPSLISLTSNTNTTNDIYEQVRAIGDTNIYFYSGNIIPAQHFNTLIDPGAVSQVAYLAELLQPLIYYGKASQNFEPFSASELQFFDPAAKNRDAAKTLENVIAFCNTALAQQNILSGGPLLPLYSQFFIEKTPVPAAVEERIVKSLAQENYYLKSNLSTYMLHSLIGDNAVKFAKFKSLVDTFSGDFNDPAISLLNKLISRDNISIVPVKDGKSVRLNLHIRAPKTSHEFNLPIQTASMVFENRMVYNPDVNLLYDIRAKLVDLVVEYQYMNSITDDNNMRNFIHHNFLQNIQKN